MIRNSKSRIGAQLIRVPNLFFSWSFEDIFRLSIDFQTFLLVTVTTTNDLTVIQHSYVPISSLHNLKFYYNRKRRNRVVNRKSSVAKTTPQLTTARITLAFPARAVQGVVITYAVFFLSDDGRAELLLGLGNSFTATCNLISSAGRKNGAWNIAAPSAVTGTDGGCGGQKGDDRNRGVVAWPLLFRTSRGCFFFGFYRFRRGRRTEIARILRPIPSLIFLTCNVR